MNESSISEVFHRYFDCLAKHSMEYWTLLSIHVNESLKDIDKLSIIVTTFFFTLVLRWLYKKILFPREGQIKRMKRIVFKVIRSIPHVKHRIQREMDSHVRKSEENFSICKNKRVKFLQKLPEKGCTMEECLKQVKEYRDMEHIQWSDGFVSGTVYNGSEELTNLMAEVFKMFAWSNPLHIDVFPDIRRMEAEVIRICCSIFHGDENTCGTMTCGGTESIMLACKVYRDLAYDRGIKHPEILVPISAHAAFDKAAEYFNIKITKIANDPVTHKVNVSAMRRAINKNVCMIVGSSPHFPYGIIDPIEDLSKLAQSYNIPMHVDACLGGFLVGFMEEAGYSLPPFDFRLPGVTSISCDTHKYGFSPKGSSVILYRENKYRLKQIFVQPNWIGGIYASPTFAGSRPGVLIAMTWASFVYFGKSGYLESTKKIIDTTRFITSSLRNIKGIKLFGEPEVSVIAFGSDVFDIFVLSDEMVNLGWHLNPLQFPSCVHICVTLVHTKPGVADRFISDVSTIAKSLMAKPGLKAEGMAAMYGMAQRIPDRSLVHEMAGSFIASCYVTRNEDDNDMNGDTCQNGVQSK